MIGNMPERCGFPHVHNRNVLVTAIMAGPPRRFYPGFRHSTWVLGLILSTAVGGCEEPVRPPAQEVTPPVLNLVFPQDSFVFDQDGDGFLDLQVGWTDAGGSGVDVASARVRSLRGGNGAADAEANLVTLWRVERRDTTGMIVHETLEELLHGGVNQIEVSVADRAGNRAVDTLAIRLPHGALWKTLDTGRTGVFQFGRGVVVCPDDERAYVAAGPNLVVVDTRRVEIVADVRDPWAVEELWFPLCVPGDSVVYATPLVERFNRKTSSWLRHAEPIQQYHGIALSRANPDHVYVGVAELAVVGIVSRQQNRRIAILPMQPSSVPRDYMLSIVPTPNDEKLYVTRAEEGGILVVDPRTGEILKRIKVTGPGMTYPGQVNVMLMDKQDNYLYAVLTLGVPAGVARVDTRTDDVTAFLPLSEYIPVGAALSPNGRRMFITTQDKTSSVESKNLLVDVETLAPIEYFPRPRAMGTLRRDGLAAFRPDGKLIFVARDLMVDVYLNRE
jgi:DNA-binding beta-propeller fold protein YncE